MNASHGTDIVCFMTDGRWPEPTRLDQLADYEIFSEKTFEEPPQLLIAYNITKDEKNRFPPTSRHPQLCLFLLILILIVLILILIIIGN
jgi:hypothetical protein